MVGIDKYIPLKKGAFISRSEQLCFSLIILLLCSSIIPSGFLLVYLVCALLLFKLDLILSHKAYFREYFLLFFLPPVFVFLHSFLSIVVYGETFFAMRSIQNFAYMMAIIFIAYSLFALHSDRALKIVICAIEVFYFMMLLISILQEGGSWFYYIRHPEYHKLNYWLEQHDVGLSTGFLLFYLIFYCKNMPGRRRHIILLSFIFLMCGKRISIFSFAVTLLYILIFVRKIDKKSRLTALWGILGLAVCYIYIYLIRSGILSTLLWSNGINMMGRDNFFRFFEPYYELSPWFLGRGSGFTGKMMQSTLFYGEQILEIHCDILKIYIEQGFLGSLLWFSFFLLFLPNHFKKKALVVAEVLFSCALYSFIIYTTDNTSNYVLFQMLYILLPISVYAKNYRINTPKQAISKVHS